MNDCRKIQIDLADYSLCERNALLDDARIKMHLTGCPACRQAAAASRRVAALLQSMPTPTLPESFDSGLQSKLNSAYSQQASSAVFARLRDRFVAEIALSPRRFKATLGLGAGLAVAAALAGGLALMPIHFGVGAPGNRLPQTGVSNPAAVMEPSSESQPQSDAAFLAACSNQQAQDASSQTIGDPSASTLAASLDETRLGAEDSKNDDAANNAD